jgi:hypothetical protein
VRSQIWIAISVYVLVAIIKKQLRLDVTLHTLLQIFSLTLFEKLPMQQVFGRVDPVENTLISDRQLKLFEFQPDTTGRTHIRSEKRPNRRVTEGWGSTESLDRGTIGRSRR